MTRQSCYTNTMFSTELSTALKKGNIKTIGDLQELFDEKSFAMIFLIFMFVPSLPIPTGGVTQFILLPVVMITSLEMAFGRRTVWLPWFVTRIKLRKSIITKALPFMIKRVKWFENIARPRLSRYLDLLIVRIITGLFVFTLAFGSAVAPPFSGLDTLPSMGAVIIALGLIFEDMAMYFAGVVVGAAGLGLIATAASLIISFFNKIF